jgi:ubiquinone/menaquinone biosynthesis C-methylase UbiE
VTEVIVERYQKETKTANLGCANLSSHFNIKHGDVVLDLGCGRGKQAIELGDKVGNDGEIIGLDLTEKMVNAANEANNKENVSFIQGDIHNLPFDNDKFHSVYSNCVINHSLEKEKVYKELYRVLKSGGHFLVGDVMSVERLPEEVSNDPEAIAACWGGAIPKDEYYKIIEECGFKNVETLSSRQYMKNGFLMESLIIKGVKL